MKEGIENLKYLWRGYERNDKGQWCKTTNSEHNRIMNEQGIHWCTSVMESYLDRVFQSTNWNDEHMNFEMRKAYRSVWFGLIVEYKTFEIRKVNVQVVANQMLSKIHAMLLSARAEGIRKFISTTQSISEIRQTTPESNRGFFSNISSLFRRNRLQQQGGYA